MHIFILPSESSGGSFFPKDMQFRNSFFKNTAVK